MDSGDGVVYDSEPVYEQRKCEQGNGAVSREEAVRFAARARRGQ